MGPLKQGHSIFISHISLRNGTYYYRINVPVDLQQYFPTAEIKKSLKTKQSKLAKVMAISLEYKVQQAFTMIRSGMLPEDMIPQVVESIVPSHQRPHPRLSVHIDCQYGLACFPDGQFDKMTVFKNHANYLFLMPIYATSRCKFRLQFY